METSIDMIDVLNEIMAKMKELRTMIDGHSNSKRLQKIEDQTNLSLRLGISC